MTPSRRRPVMASLSSRRATWLSAMRRVPMSFMLLWVSPRSHHRVSLAVILPDRTDSARRPMLVFSDARNRDARARPRGFGGSPRRLDAGFGHGEAHMHAGARLALNNPQFVACAGDDPEPQPEARAVISRRHAHAVVCDQDPHAAAGRRHTEVNTAVLAFLSIAIGMQHDVGDGLRDGQLDRGDIDGTTLQHRADIVPGLR